jgi:hypothetical protein
MACRSVSPLRILLPLVLLAAGLGSVPAAAQDLKPPEPADGGPIEIQVSFVVADVLRILDAEQVVEADLFWRLQWHDERFVATEEGAGPRTFGIDEVWSPIFLPTSPRGLSSLLPDVVVADPDGTMIRTQRLVGKFGMPTNLRDFPFDRHQLAFRFFAPNRLEVAMELLPGSVLGTAEAFSVPDWTLRGGELDLTPLRISDALPETLAASFVLEAERNTSHYLTKIILPLIVIVMISWTVFWAPPPQIAVQFGFAATSILTVIAYRFALASQLPPVPYSTRLDEFLNGAFMLVALALVEVVVTAQLIFKDRTATALKVDVFCRVAFPVLLLAVAAWSFLA